MKPRTIAIHVGYQGDPATNAVAVPIYQTVAFEFDSAEHGAALFNLEVQGNIYTRIGNPTNTVLEKRVAALEGGVDALSVSSGMAAIEYSLSNIAESGNNIVSLPQLYGATYTLLAHIFPKRGILTRFAKTDHPDEVDKLIDESTRASTAKVSEIPPAMSPTLKAWRGWRTSMESRWWSTTRLRRRFYCVRSDMAPMWWCIP